MQNYYVDNPTAMSEGRHMINPTKDKDTQMIWMIKNAKGEWWSARRFADQQSAQKHIDQFAEKFPGPDLSKLTVVETN
jgi:hypothetical protein